MKFKYNKFLYESLNTFLDDVNGLSHFGASTGQEIPLYQHLGIEKLNLFEPQQKAYEILEKNCREHENINIYNFGLGAENFRTTLNIADFKTGESSSILNPKLHLDYHPDVEFKTKEEIEIKRYDSLNLSDNFLVLDIQGYELEALKGCQKKLNEIDFIFTEINYVEHYAENPLTEDLDSYLKKFGFIRFRTNLDVWMMFGDAFYIKQEKLNRMEINLIKLKNKILYRKFFIYFKRIFKFKDYKKIIKRYLKK